MTHCGAGMRLLVFADQCRHRVDDTVGLWCFVLRLEVQTRRDVHATAHDDGTVGGQAEGANRIGQGIGFAGVKCPTVVLVDKDDSASDVTVQAGVRYGQRQLLCGYRDLIPCDVRNACRQRVGQVAAQCTGVTGRYRD